MTKHITENFSRMPSDAIVVGVKIYIALFIMSFATANFG